MLYTYYRINIDTALMSIEPTKVIYSEMRNSIYSIEVSSLSLNAPHMNEKNLRPAHQPDIISF